MIVHLASYPRSGVTRVRNCLEAAGLRTFSRYDESGNPDMTGGYERSHFVEGGGGLSFVKTHELPEGDGHPAIHVLRDGRDALLSHAHYLRACLELDPFPWKYTVEMLLERLIDGSLILYRPNGEPWHWARHTSAWLDRPNTWLVRYEDMAHHGAPAVLRPVLAQIGIDADLAEEPDFENLHAKHPVFYRRGRVGSWYDEMSERLADRFSALYGSVLERAGYPTEVLI